MAANHFIVVRDVNDFQDEPVSIQGAFIDRDDAVKLIHDLAHDGIGPVTDFEIEWWQGRRFKGAFDHEGNLIEKADGTEVRKQQ